MKKLLYIDCCIRGEISRTRRLANAFFGALPAGEFEFERLDLDALNLLPLNSARLIHRESLLAEGKTNDPLFDLPKQLAAADFIVVAAPFWDMGIPAALKTYFENVSVAGITFDCDADGNSRGLCRAEKMIFLTSRGFEIEEGSDMEQATPYLKALVAFFGIGGIEIVSVCGTDVNSPEEVERRLIEGEKAAVALAEALNL